MDNNICNLLVLAILVLIFLLSVKKRLAMMVVTGGLMKMGFRLLMLVCGKKIICIIANLMMWKIGGY